MDQFRFGKYLKKLERQGSYVLAFLVLSVLAFGVVYSIILGDELRFLPDESNYLVLAQNLAEKGTYSLPFYSWFIDPCLDTVHTEMPTAFRVPGYPLVLSVVFWIGGNIVHARILNFLFLAGTMIIVYLLLRGKRTALAGLIGAAGVIAYPVLMFTAGAFYPQTLAVFLFAAVLF